MLIERRLRLNPKRHHLLLGPRRVGKSTFLHTTLPDATYIDLLKSDVFFDYHREPSLLRQRFARLERQKGHIGQPQFLGPGFHVNQRWPFTYNHELDARLISQQRCGVN